MWSRVCAVNLAFTTTALRSESQITSTPVSSSLFSPPFLLPALYLVHLLATCAHRSRPPAPRTLHAGNRSATFETRDIVKDPLRLREGSQHSRRGFLSTPKLKPAPPGTFKLRMPRGKSITPRCSACLCSDIWPITRT